MFKHFVHGLLAASLIAAAAGARADDYVVIVNKANDDPVSKEFVEKAYRGEAKNWPSGGTIDMAVLPESNALRAAFDRKVLDKTPAQSKGMWAQMTFAGKIVPPKTLEGESDVVKFVSEDKHAIGYVSSGAVGAGVKVAK
jgi:ABC-type phosphate transport system substrate-binding protein